MALLSVEEFYFLEKAIKNTVTPKRQNTPQVHIPVLHECLLLFYCARCRCGGTSDGARDISVALVVDLCLTKA